MKTPATSARTLVAALLVALCCMLVPDSKSLAGQEDKVPSTVVTLSSGSIEHSSVTLADLDHDGKQEILVASGRDADGQYRGNGMVTVVSADGHVLWSAQGRGPGDKFNAAVERQAPINSAVTVMHDIDGDGWDDLVVGLGGLPQPLDQSNWHGGVAAFSGRTGQRLWIFYSDDWLSLIVDGFRDGVYSTPAVGDVEGDGRQEIVFGSWDQCIYMLDDHGNPLWTNTILRDSHPYCNGGHGQYNQDTIWSSPALADLDGDAKKEVIIGADITAGNVNHDPSGGYLYVFSHTGQILGRAWLDQTIWSSPAVADLDGDGRPEIVVGTGANYPGKGHYVTAWDYVPGQGLVMKWQRDTVGQVMASPAIADLNGDGVRDVIEISYNGDSNDGACGSRSSQVYAWRGNDGALLPGFPMTPQAISGMYPQCNSSSPVIGDVTNDGQPDVVFGLGGEVTILNRDGSQYTDNQPHGGKPTYWAGNLILGSPAISDIDGDGKLEIVAGSYVPGAPPHGAVYIWKTAAPAAKAPAWPMFHHDPQHTGAIERPPDATAPTNPARLTGAPAPQQWSNQSQIQISWSGAYDAGSGIERYYYCCDTSPTTIPGPSSSSVPDTAPGVTVGPLPDSASWYCHVRVKDRAGNWALGAAHIGPFLLDTMPPASRATASRFAVSGKDLITWSGRDDASGVAGYWIERKVDAGAWAPWQSDVGGGTAPNGGEVGKTYYFSSRAKDGAGNMEANHAAYDVAVTVTRYAGTVKVMNNRDEPIIGGQVQGIPSLVGGYPSNRDGVAAIFFNETGTRRLAVTAQRFGVLPPRTINLTGNSPAANFYLPPADNVMAGSGFEGSLDPAWQATGSVTILSNASAYAGDGSVQLSGQATLKQTQAVSAAMRRPTLSFMYQAPNGGLSGSVRCGATALPLNLARVSTWSHASLALDACRGQALVVQFTNSGNSTALLDEVSVGSSEAGGYTNLLPLLNLG